MTGKSLGKSPPKFAHEWLNKYKWLLSREIFPPGIEFAGLLEAAEQERARGPHNLYFQPKDYGLTRCALVSKSGQKVGEVEINYIQNSGPKGGFTVSLHELPAGGNKRFMGDTAFRDLLRGSAYCLFWNSEDLAIILLWILKD